jgi:hypothetical protein
MPTLQMATPQMATTPAVIGGASRLLALPDELREAI